MEVPVVAGEGQGLIGDVPDTGKFDDVVQQAARKFNLGDWTGSSRWTFLLTISAIGSLIIQVVGLAPTFMFSDTGVNVAISVDVPSTGSSVYRAENKSKKLSTSVGMDGVRGGPAGRLFGGGTHGYARCYGCTARLHTIQVQIVPGGGWSCGEDGNS